MTQGWREAGRLALLLALSVGFESLFVHHGLNEVDEGWPLYAATQLHAGGTLYRDVFFVFPPGHLLPAWIGVWLDPPGVVATRVLYAAFNVALVLASYGLARRLTSPGFAWTGAALVAVTSPLSHIQHLLFGYRFLVFAVLALLAFGRRLRTGDARWMALAGAWTGLALVFRLTPAVSVACGIGVGILLAARSPRAWLRDAAWYAAGALVVAAPVAAWLLASVGAETLWREVMVRPVAMTAAQDKPIPPVLFPDRWHRLMITRWFVSLLFRVVPLVYAAVGLALLARWVRALAAGRRGAPDPLLAALLVFGVVFFTRALGRADEPHLASALPPFCLVLAVALGALFRPRVWRGRAAALRRPAAALAGGLLLAVWTFGHGSDRYLDPEVRGTLPVEALDGRVRVRPGHRWVDPRVRAVVEAVPPGESVLVLGPQSLLYVLTGRPGPGGADVLMPSTFLDEAEERAFVERLLRDPPALVLWPRLPFDLSRARAIESTAPRVVAFVEERYRPTLDRDDRFAVWLLRRHER